jgi:hypothetical protein
MKRLLFLVLGAAFLIVVYALLTVSPKAAIHYGHDFNAVADFHVFCVPGVVFQSMLKGSPA